METKFKLPTKVLSMFLSLLMAFGCFSIVLPEFAPTANASTTAQWTALQNAFDAAKTDGIMSTSKATYTDNGTSVTIDDTSAKGHLFKIAELLYAVVTSDYASYTHHEKMRAYVKGQLSLNTYQQDFVDALLPVYGNYGYYDGNKYTTPGQKGSYPAAPFSGNITLSVTVTRTVKAAINMEYADDVNRVPSSVNTKISYSVTATAQSANGTHTTSQWESSYKDGTKNKTTIITDNYYTTYGWYVNSGAPSYNLSSTATPDLTAVKNYLNYVNSSAFKDGYDAWSANPGCIYDWDVDVLSAVEPAYKVYADALSSVDNYYVNMYIGNTNKAFYDQYPDACTGAVEAAKYLPYIEWIMYGEHVDGYLDKGSEEDWDEVRVPANRENLAKLLSDTQKIYDIVENCSDGTKTAFQSRYGYESGFFDAYIKELTDLIEIYDLTDIYDEIIFRMTHDETEIFNEKTDLWGAINYESYKYTSEGNTCPVDDIMLEQVAAWFDAKIIAIEGSFDAENVTKVFADNNDGKYTLNDVKAFLTELNTELDYRDYEVKFADYYSYFEGIRYERYNLVSFKSISSLIPVAEKKLAELRASYNAAVTDLGEAKAKQIYGSYADEIDTFIKSLYDVLYDRAYTQLYNLLDTANDIDGGKFDGTQADEITNANFSAVKRAIKDIDVDLYNWVLDNCTSKDTATLQKWYGFIPDYEAAVNVVIAAAWNAFQQIQLDTPGGSGYYTTRYALEKDMVREAELDEDDYIVTETKILTVIEKLDNFITSDSFAKLTGLYSAEDVYEDGELVKRKAENLSEYIDGLLKDLLFSDEMVNTLVAMLFPMLTDLIGGLIKDLFNKDKTLLEPSWVLTPTNADADGALDLGAMMATVDMGDFSITQGKLDVWLDGKKSTPKLAKAFSDLGIKIYPQYFAESLASTSNGKAGKYNKIISALKAAGEDWTYFDKVANGGNGDGEVTGDDLANYVWGVSDYTTFCAVIGDIFTSILPVLQVVFTNYTYTTAKITDLLYAYGEDIKLKYGSFSGKVNAYAYGDLQLTLNGIEGYNNIWGTLFEALNISETVNSYNPTTTYPLSTTFGTSGNSATAAQFANCLFVPLLALVERLAEKPIDTLMGIVPNLMQSVSYNFVQPLLDALYTSINIKATIDIKDITKFDFGLGNWSGVADIFKSTINKYLVDVVDVNVKLNFGDLIDLADLLGVDDLSDINGIINHFLIKEDDAEGAAVGDGETPKIDFTKISIPTINAGMWASLGKKTQTSSIRSVNKNSTLGAKQRYTIVADKADMLYALLDWLLEFVAIEGNLSGLLETFGMDSLGEDIDAILAGIDADNALAALIELFLPQDYSLADYDWYQPNSAASQYSLTAADFVYLKYANNWTRDKAEYLYNNIDELANTIIEMIKPGLLDEYDGNVNNWLLDEINSMFDNEGVMNVIDLVYGIGEALADQETITDLIKDQISFEGSDEGLDLMQWYDSFGYLVYDYDDPDNYDDEGRLSEYAPKKPGEEGYVNYFPLSVQVDTVLDDDGNPKLDKNGNEQKEYHWYVYDEADDKTYALVDGADNAREVFTKIFCVLLEPLSPVVGLLFSGKDLGLFNNALILNGAECYKGAIVPLFEMLGIYDLYTQEQYNEKFGTDSAAGFEYLVNKLFDRFTEILTVETRTNADGTTYEYGPFQKIVDMLPSLFYFIQSDGLSSLLKNLLHPVWSLVDTIRPIIDVDLDAFIHKFLTGYLGLCYDEDDTVNYPSAPLVDLLFKLVDMGITTPEYSKDKAEEDKDLVDGIFALSIEKLNLEAIYFVVETMFGLDLSSLTYALEGMCVPFTRDGVKYGVREYQSASGKKAYTLDYNGPDTLTVTVCALLDVLTYKDNAAALDKLLGFIDTVRPSEGNQSSLTATGLVEAITLIFEDKDDSWGTKPNWDYLLENKIVVGYDKESKKDIFTPWVDEDYKKLLTYSDMSGYHSINNLSYYTDWTEDTAKATDEVLKNVLDYVITLIDKDAADFGTWIDELLAEKVFSAGTLKSLAGLMGKMFDYLPTNIVTAIDKLLDIDLNDWLKYVELDASSKKYVANASYKWWADSTKTDYVNTKDEFLAALTEMLTPVSKLLGMIFLGSDYRLFYTIDNGPGSAGYGDDAIVLNGLNAYAKGIVPIFEALGLDLTNYKPDKYNKGVDTDGNMIYDEALFVSDFIEILSNLIDMVKEDPVNWLVDILPGLVYFINANGISTSLMNIVDSVVEVLDIVNSMLDDDKQIDLSNIKGIDLTNLTLSGIFGIVETFTGIVVREDLNEYLSTLYVGQLKAYTSANEQTAFTMEYSTVEERHDMITILLALLVEIVADKGVYTDGEGKVTEYDNAAAIDKLINGDKEDATDYVSGIIGALKDPESVIYKEINWNYFDETVDLSKVDEDGKIEVPGYAFQYLNYTTDWTYAGAYKTAEGLEEIILAVLSMTGTKVDEGDTLADVLKDLVDINSFYTGETLQKLLDLISPYLFGEKAVLNESLLELIGAMLGADLTQWNNNYAFESKVEGATYTLDADTGLYYRTVDSVKTYAVNGKDEFIKGAVVLFEPTFRLLSWLLFGEGYEFFNGNTEATKDDVLITIQGSEGYKEGLALLLEALGCTGLSNASKYETTDASGQKTVDMKLFMTDLATSLAERIDAIFANPVDEVTALIPELLYFINAGGLQVSVGNLLAGPLNLVNTFAELSGNASLSVDGLIEGLLRKALKNDEFTFTLDGINLQYIFEVVELLTGLEITDVVGNKLAYFYMGEIVPYISASGKRAYIMRFSTEEDLADFITILLSFVVDIALYGDNGVALEKLFKLNDGLIPGIINAIKESYTIIVQDIDWFYFDDTIDSDDLEFEPNNTTVKLPGRTINYLSYASDWNKETADYVFQNRNEIVAAILSMSGKGDSTLADIIAESFSLDEDLYTAKNLNAIIDLVTKLTGSLDEAITDLLDIVINVDLGVYNTMEKFTDNEITDRISFVNGLYEVLYPVFPVLDWLLFGDDMTFFDKKIVTEVPEESTTEEPTSEEPTSTPAADESKGYEIEVLINLPGAEGYAYGLVPLFEALGVELPAIKSTDTTEDIFYVLVNNALARAEAILADPVDEALALLPNLLYFINANGLSAVVNNLAGGILTLLDTVNEFLPDNKKISIEKFLADALKIDQSLITLDNLDLLYLMEIAELATGLEITDVLTETKIDKFYLGQMEYYTSANGKPAFKMVYSETEGGAEMLTIVVNMLLEVVLYKDEATGVDNVAALEKLLKLDEGTINDIIDIIPILGTEPNYEDYNWNYMGGTIDPVTYDIKLPKTAFMNYFTYKSDVTQDVANYFYDHLDELVLGILRMTGSNKTLEEMIAGSFNLYSAKYLNDLVDLTKELYKLADKKLIEIAGMVLGIDVTLWDGLEYTDADVYDRETFIDGLVEVITPIYRVLDWLLFDDSFEFFVENADGTTILLKVAGNEGYKYGLAPLLEALGVDLPTLVASPSCATMFRPVVEATLERYDEIMNNVIDEALELLPELLYFINANGLSTAVKNLAGSVFNVLDVLADNGIANVDIEELLGIDLDKLDLEAVFQILEDQKVLGDFKFNDAFKGYTTVNADGSVTFTRDLTGENIIKKFYIGDIDPYVSSTGEMAYKMHLTEESRGDMVVLLLSFAVDAVLYGDNSKALDKLFKIDEGTVGGIAALFAQKMEFAAEGFNWVYFLDLTDDELDEAIEKVLAGKLNELPALPERTLHYIEYDNNWNEETAEYLVENLPDIVDLIIAMVSDSADLNELLSEYVDIYNNDTVNWLVEQLLKLLDQVDEYVLNHAGVLLGVDLDTLRNFKATDVTDKASFCKALATALGSVGEILDLVLFGEDFELFTKLENGEPALLTVSGNDGYELGLAPLLSMLGVDTNIGTIPEVDGELSITEQVIETILLRICDRLDEILANPVDEVFDILLNLFYFVNADGLTASVKNVTAPIDYILEGIGDITGDEMSLSDLIKFDITDLSFAALSELLKEETGLDVWGAVGDYLGKFYFGELEYYEYAEGMGAFRMVYTEDEEAHDFITIVLSVVLDTFVYEGNRDALIKLFGDDGEAIYNVIMAFLTDSEVAVPMKPYQWLFTEKADTGIVLSPITGGGLYNYTYGKLYTREMGEYITKWLPSFIDTMIVLLGVEDSNGNLYKGLEDILDSLLGSSIYKPSLIEDIKNALVGLIDDLKKSIGDELFTHIANVLDSALGVDLAFWDDYTVAQFAEGDKEAFVNELLRVLTPAYPLLEWLLTDEDLAFFNKDDGIDDSVVSDKNSYVIIHGAEGYAYGIIPILEAFGYDNDKILTPADYKAAANGDPEALLRNVLDPILARLDAILADPINELLATLPGIIYFLNSKGLDTAFNNAINAVIRVLETIEPLTGEIDLYEIIGFDFEVDIEGLIDQLLESVKEDTGFELTEVAMEAITELTLGEIISFVSKNGDDAYTMIYATGGDSVDLVTIILRLILTFVSIPDNVVAIEALLKDSLSDDGYKFLCSLLENFSQMAASEDGMDEIMYTVYQIFYAANVAAHKTNDWLNNFNGDYSFLNQLFATSDLAFMRQLEISFGDLLNKYTGNIIDDDEIVPNGFIAFFKSIGAFFQKILDFFKNLFK